MKDIDICKILKIDTYEEFCKILKEITEDVILDGNIVNELNNLYNYISNKTFVKNVVLL